MCKAWSEPWLAQFDSCLEVLVSKPRNVLLLKSNNRSTYVRNSNQKEIIHSLIKKKLKFLRHKVPKATFSGEKTTTF